MQPNIQLIRQRAIQKNTQSFNYKIAVDDSLSSHEAKV
jgi:hypothetical protein